MSPTLTACAAKQVFFFMFGHFDCKFTTMWHSRGEVITARSHLGRANRDIDIANCRLTHIRAAKQASS